MNRQELIALISHDIGHTKASTGRFLDSFIDTIQSTLAKGDKVTLTGFGNFESVKTAARKGRNPSTGESMKISPSVRPKFKAGSNFIAAVRNASNQELNDH